MKKTFIALLALCLLCTMVFAASATSTETSPQTKTEDESGNIPSQNIPVTGTVNDLETVYSVDISWGSMAFTYTPSNVEWNPEKLTYEDTGKDGTWAPASVGSNQITVENNSNAPVNVAVAFTAAEAFTVDKVPMIDSSFTYEIQAAVVGGDTESGDQSKYEKAVMLDEVGIGDNTITYSAVFELTLSKNITDLSLFNGAGVGTVTVTLSKVTPEMN